MREPDGPYVAEPVSIRSRIVRAEGVRYTEVDGNAVVWEPTERVLHELSPAAAGLWANLDGRPLGEVIAQVEAERGLLADGSRPSPTEVEVLDAVRRLRALRLVGDVSPGQGPVEELGAEGAPPEWVQLTADLVDVDDELLVVLRGDATVEVDVTRNVVLAERDAAPVPIGRFVILEADRPEPRPLTPVQLLGALRAACPDVQRSVRDRFAVHPLLLDALAAVAEAVPGQAMDDQALARFST